MRAIRLELKLQRFQLASVAVASLALAAVAVFLIWQLTSIGYPVECTSLEEIPASIVCDSRQRSDFNAARSTAAAIAQAFAGLPWLAGILVGATVVSQEIEGRTAVLAWTIGASRSRWFWRRVIILLSLTVAMVAVPSFLAVILEGAERPLVDPWMGFNDHHSRGIVLIGRLVLAFAIATLAGAALGRVLPAIVIGAGLAAVALSLILTAFPLWMPARELPTEAGGAQPGSIPFATRYRLPDGRVVTFEEMEAASPFPVDSEEYQRWRIEEVDEVYFGYPREAATEVSIRETVVTLGLGLTLLGVCSLVVRRRKPY
jgi:hypothetical protein